MPTIHRLPLLLLLVLSGAHGMEWEDDVPPPIITRNGTVARNETIVLPVDNFWSVVKKLMPAGWEWSGMAVAGFGLVAVTSCLMCLVVSLVFATLTTGFRPMLTAMGLTMAAALGAALVIAVAEYRGVILLGLAALTAAVGALNARRIMSSAETALTLPTPRPVVDVACSAINWGAVCAAAADDAGDLVKLF